MIVNERQRENTRRKLARLEERAALTEQRLCNEADCDPMRLTLHSYRRLIRQLQEEISRYELGHEPSSQQRLTSDMQLSSAISKLESLQRREAEHKAEPASVARNVNLFSLRRTIKQLQEEIAWYQVHRDQPAHVTDAEIK